jgi:putative transposase
MPRVVHDAEALGDAEHIDLDELCRLAARQMIAVALEAERRAYLERYAEEVDGAGCRASAPLRR